MTRTGMIFILVGLLDIIYISKVDGGGGKLLSRRKRYVVFPEGSSFSIALCMTVHTITSDNIFTEGLNWGVSYDLPNESNADLAPLLQFRTDKLPANKFIYKNPQDNYKNNDLKYSSWNNDRNYQVISPKRYFKSDKYYVRRRHRRDLYDKMEVIMNAMGFDGRTCVLRALCEASQRLMPKGNTLIEEMMRIAFSLPLKKIFSFEPPEHHVYDAAHRAGHQGHDCTKMFPACSFSLIDMALGNYNSAETNYDQVPVNDEKVGEMVNSNTELPSRKYNMK